MQPKGLFKFLRFEGFAQNVKEYVENRIAIAKLEAKQKVADVASTLAALIPAALFGLFALTFLSLALAMAINVWLDSAVWGFLIVGVLYLIGAYAMFTMRDSEWLKKKVVDGSTKFLKEKPKQEKTEETPPAGYHAPQVEHTKVIFEDPVVSMEDVQDEEGQDLTTRDREPHTNATAKRTSHNAVIIPADKEEDRS